MTPEEWKAGEFEKYRVAWEAGRFDALSMAVQFCGQNGFVMPEWMVKPLQACIHFTLLNQKSGHGRTGSVKAAARQDQIHLERYFAAEKCLRLRKLLPGYGKTREGAFKRAAKDLQGSPARGSWGAVEASHKIVRRALKAGTGERFTFRD